MKHQDRVADIFFQIKCYCGQCNPIFHTPKPKLRTNKNQVVVSKILNFNPENGGRFPILTNMFQMVWFNHQPKNHVELIPGKERREPERPSILQRAVVRTATGGGDSWPLEDLLIWWVFFRPPESKNSAKKTVLFGIFPPASLTSHFIRCCGIFSISCLYVELVWDKPLPLALFFSAMNKSSSKTSQPANIVNQNHLQHLQSLEVLKHIMKPTTHI